MSATEHPVGTTFSVDLPPEPPDRSVVIDKEGLSWQRLGSWVRNGAVVLLFSRAEGSFTWPELLVAHGPVTLVYAPEPPVKASTNRDSVNAAAVTE